MANSKIGLTEVNYDATIICKLEGSSSSETENIRHWKHSQQLLALFPEEVWIYIISFLDNIDFLNLNNTSPFFRRLLVKKHVLCLFEPVLNILVQQFGKLCAQKRSGTECEVISILKTSRLVCRNWRRAIDKQACNWDGEALKKHGSVHNHLSKNYNFGVSKQIVKFMENFDKTHSSTHNPFPGKYVSFSFVSSLLAQFVPFAAHFSRLMEKYGEHLSTFEFLLGLDFNSPYPHPHQKFVEWLHCTPNLQNLQITFLIPLTLDSDPRSHVIQAPPKLFALRKLVVLAFRPCFMSGESLGGFSWIERYNLLQLIQVQENLEHFQIDLFNKADIHVLRTVRSPLKSLSINYKCKEEEEIHISEFFTVLSEFFSNSLECLKLKFMSSSVSSVRMRILRDSVHARLKMSKLRKFEIHIANPLCLDFLLGTQCSLEELTINPIDEPYSYDGFSKDELKEIDNIKRAQVIKYLGCESNMTETHLRCIFTQLKVYQNELEQKDNTRSLRNVNYES